jgi:GDP-L-fucose synthase
MACQAYRRQHGHRYISVVPCNLYGPHDNFDLETSHVIPALMRKFHEAKREKRREVVVWGTGTPLREFLHVDDLAKGVVFCLDHNDEYEHVNCGAGQDFTIKTVAEKVAAVVGFDGRIIFDASKPDGTPRKIMDSSRLRGLGWRPAIPLDDGVRSMYGCPRSRKMFSSGLVV